LKKDKIAYFDRIAEQTANRKLNLYYKRQIVRYCDYFSHDEFSVLEIGCGTGRLIGSLKGNNRVGIDFSPAMLEIARKNYPDVEFLQMDAEEIKIDRKFDLIIISDLVGYLEDVQAVFTSIQQLCHTNTKILVTYYNYLWEPVLKLGESLGIKLKTPIQNWLTQQDIKNLLFISGYDVYRDTKRILFPFYIPFFSGLMNKYIAKLPLIRYFCLNHYTFAKPLPVVTEEVAKLKYSVSVVIPARNESGNIENAILRLPKLGNHTEIIFIEGNSTDDTWDKICEIQEKYKDTHDIKTGRQKGKGKADAVRLGYEMASCDILMILDADLTVPPEDLGKFYHVMASGRGDFINGSRLVYPMEKEAMRFLNLLGNKFFSMAFSWLLDQPFKDTLCGTKVIFRKDYYKLKSNRSFFGEFDPFGDFDLIFGAYKLNLRIVELPIRYRERTYGSTNISRFKHGLILLRMCLFAARKIKFY
jgi:SAM-dependent methyltransferase